MITMDVKGITWVGNMYHKFENMCLEVEDMMYEDAVKYMKSQMQIVGKSVKKLYSDIMGDLLPPDEKEDTELPIDQYTNAGFCKKQFQFFKEKPVKDDIKQTTEDLRIDHDVDNEAIHTASYDGTCEISNENQNQNHGISASKLSSAEVTRLASEADSLNEIENASTKQFPSDQVLVRSAEEKEINMRSSSSCVALEEPVEQGHKTMQQDHLKLEQSCVMVNGHEIQLPPKAGGNLNNNKKKKQAFSLSKKSARKQEYKELAAWHEKSEKVKGYCMENLDPTLAEDQKKLLLPSVSEPDWELI
ncbi:uncharacterized protein LOC113858004 [Abrus precatorius]|uniref:Uncharacterized protein LOC113858004 n=1 Tax=Abrus precatorius TaxID=3816 RepID=A0A8B8KUE9_ABRPR|nr:uncharacterized protein LOC113858004 [Abrus precatorius]